LLSLVQKLNHDRLASLNTQMREHLNFMTIKVKFFASLREHVGQAEAEIDDKSVRTVADVWRSVTKGLAFPDNTLMAVNMDYVEASHSVKKGDEVAFFPPVTGG